MSPETPVGLNRKQPRHQRQRRKFLGPDPRSSRREEAHSNFEFPGQSLLTSAATRAWSGPLNSAIRNPRSAFARAFTLVELLVVLAIIALLASLFLPSLGRTKSAAITTKCKSNLKQLQLGWQLYLDANNDSFPPNISRKSGFDQFNVIVDGRVPWVLGNAKLDTNTANIEAGVLFKHAGSAAIYRCPADKSTVRELPSLRRARSYSTHEYFNSEIVSDTAADTLNDSDVILTKASQLVNPGPGSTFVFIDEHEMSIDDGIFGIEPWRPPYAGQTWIWGSFPGDRHNNGANLSFADGHVETHRWRAHRIITSYPGGKTSISPGDTANLEDHHWLWERIPRVP